MSFLSEENNIEIAAINTAHFTAKNIGLSIARLDKIHPVVSGNKLFKLHYFLKQALNNPSKTIVTFGGAYSNHLAATAFAAKECGLRSIGIVRGEKPETLSHTLKFCLGSGMKLDFISRERYRNVSSPLYLSQLEKEHDAIIIPEGGFHPDGSKGASLIFKGIEEFDPTHICVPVGTATTLAGLALSAKTHQKIIGFPVLKNMTDISERISFLANGFPASYEIIDGYHFGGYAKWNNKLIDFMNVFYTNNHIPLDFVYTAKMMYGTIEKIKEGYFPESSRILCLHTGGLQGNDSLPKDTLLFNS